MRKVLFSVVAAVAIPASAQPTADVCKLMSVEEMQVCQATKPGDATGARSIYCDQVAAAQIDRCLQQARTPQSTPASGGASAPAREPAAPRSDPPKEPPPDRK
jgi:hypothetical protein